MLLLLTGLSFDNTLKDELERLTTFETNLEVKILDTAVTLSNLRDNIKNPEVHGRRSYNHSSAIKI